jgi:hypothetical protein
MSNATVFASLKSISAAYSQRLEQLTDLEFQTTPHIGGWSYAEVYAHIFDASLLSLQAIANCTPEQGERKPTALLVKLILWYGGFPPQQKYKVPKVMEGRVCKITIAEARSMINAFLQQLQVLYPFINTADQHLKRPHPRLGYLNTTDWLRFIEIHLKHHLKQLKRIEKSF